MRITYTGVGLFWIWLFVNAFTLSAQEKLELSGKIRVLEPVEMRLENIKGEVLQKTVIIVHFLYKLVKLNRTSI